MNFPLVPAKPAGQPIEESYLATIRESVNNLIAPPRCHVRHSVNLSIPNATLYRLPHDTEIEDNDVMHEVAFPANERINIRTAGRYALTGLVSWGAGTSSTGALSVVIAHNDSASVFFGEVKLANVDSARPPQMLVYTERTLTTTDWVTLQVYQDTGAAKTIDRWQFMATRLG